MQRLTRRDFLKVSAAGTKVMSFWTMGFNRHVLHPALLHRLCCIGGQYKLSEP